MYGIAKGVGGCVVLGEPLTGEVDFEVIFDSTIQRISLGTISSDINNKSHNNDGVTFTGGSDENSAITIQGTSINQDSSRGHVEQLYTNTNITLEAGYYCFDTNRIGNFDSHLTCECSVYDAPPNQGQTKGFARVYLSSNKSNFFYLSSRLAALINTHVVVWGGGVVPSGCSVNPRLFYLGSNPFAKLKKNNAVIGSLQWPATNYLSGQYGFSIHYGPNYGPIKNGTDIKISPPSADCPAINVGKNVDLVFGIETAKSVHTYQVQQSSGGYINQYNYTYLSPSFIITGAGAKVDYYSAWRIQPSSIVALRTL